jgi:hypothetical protein
VSGDAVAAIEAILARGGDADAVLRETVGALASCRGIEWAGVAFLDEGVLALGPTAGAADESRRVRMTISYEGDPVGELLADGGVERGTLERVAELIAPYVLIGWDTGGEPWEP